MVYLDSYKKLLRYRQRTETEAGGRINLSLVPTMGNFHPGHIRLVDLALERSDKVMVSIYVNPTQFNQREDFVRYPRALESDIDKLSAYEEVIIFTPDDDDIYPYGVAMDCSIRPPQVANILEGEFRLGHFTGVATVVAKLLNLVQPQLLILGKKDYQQLRVLEKMVREMRYPCEIYGAETVREDSGLAYSSRNERLSKAERKLAPMLHRQLSTIRDRLGKEGLGCLEECTEEAKRALSEEGFNVEYLQLRTQKRLHYASPQTRDAVILAAAWLGQVRLIDNLELVIG